MQHNERKHQVYYNYSDSKVAVSRGGVEQAFYAEVKRLAPEETKKCRPLRKAADCGVLCRNR